MPSTELRQTVLTSARRIVVKIGTQLLTLAGEQGPGIDVGFVQRIADQIVTLRKAGCEVTLVSSGAIGAGCVELGLNKRPTDVADQQAVAAVGQRRLMDHMHVAFSKHGLRVGQLLLTRTDFDDRVRFLNLRNCVTRLHQLGCVPILNENDTVAVEEIRFGDNDLLAALMCHAVQAEALVLLTTVAGLMDREGQVIDLVDNVSDYLSLARQETSQWGTGGMLSKLEAARLAVDSGEVAVIACGRERDVLPRLLAGEKIGTIFVPGPRKLDSRQRWIGLTARPAGTITIDDGATNALRARGKSLLASGITDITGQFDRGEVLIIRDARGREAARGLTNYSDQELRQIMGKRSNQFAKILGRPAYAAVIHRDNLVLKNGAAPT